MSEQRNAEAGSFPKEFVTLLLAVMGAVLGAAMGAFGGLVLAWSFGLLIGGLLGWLVGWVLELRQRMDRLDQRLQQLEVPEAEPGVQAEERHQAGASEHDEPIQEPETVPSHSAELEPTPWAQSPQTPQASPEQQEAAPATQTPMAGSGGLVSMGQRIRDWLIGGNVVLRVGLVVLFFGLAFLLKYSVDNALVPIELRISGVALLGMVMLGVGYWLTGSRWLYGVLLQGGGVGVMYLTVFTALRLYELLPPGLAFALLVLLSVLFAVLAIVQDARSLAAFAAAGGFLAPILASSGEGSHVVLFSYYAILNAGIVGIAYFRAWRELNLIGFLFTFVIAVAWGVAEYQPQHYATTQPFLVLFFLFFVALPVLFARLQPPRLRGMIDGTLVFGVPLVGFGLQAGLLEDQPLMLSLSAALVAALYLALARVLWKGDGMRGLAEAFLALGIVFITLAMPLALDSEWTATAWALEGAGLVWVGVRQDRLLPRLSGSVLQFGAGVSFALALLEGKDWSGVPVLNGFYVGCLIVSLSALVSGWLINRRPGAPEVNAWSGVLLGWALLWWFGGGLSEIERQVPPEWFGGANMLLVSASTVVFTLLSQRLAWRQLGAPAMALWPLVLLVALTGLEEDPLGHYLSGGDWLGWAGFFLAHGFLIRRADWPGIWLKVSHGAGLCLLVLLLAVELGWLASALDGTDATGSWRVAVWGLVPALAILALASNRLDGVWPVRDGIDVYKGPGLYPVMAVAGFWFVLGWGHAGGMVSLAYVPVLNPLDLVQALLPVAIYLWWERAGHQFLGDTARGPALACLGGMAFIWLNGVLARTVHHWGGIDYALELLFHAEVLHSAMAVAWGASAMLLMGGARLRMSRALWLVGAALLGLTVVKLFLVDLAGTGTVTRIVSFLGVGLLMLFIGYVAPLPPDRSGESRASVW